MQTVNNIYRKFLEELSLHYEPEEREQVIVLVFEHILNFRRIDISSRREEIVSQESSDKLFNVLAQLTSGKPVQYILGEAFFYGLNLMVNEHVLIPRRETEELVDWIVKEAHSTGNIPGIIVDFCTGSGCIALALKKEFPGSRIIAVDISEQALEVAKNNARKLNLEIEFILSDVLTESLDVTADIAVSNPPYVMEKERREMHSRVLNHEPWQALFVTDENSLLFYRRIAGWAKENLRVGGKLYFEINENRGIEIINMLEQKGYVDVVLKKDMQDKIRMSVAVKNASILKTALTDEKTDEIL